jgi:hypothetical protein
MWTSGLVAIPIVVVLVQRGAWQVACTPDGQFHLDPGQYRYWSRTGFFQITLTAVSELSFEKAKLIDIAWDVVRHIALRHAYLLIGSGHWPSRASITCLFQLAGVRLVCDYIDGDSTDNVSVLPSCVFGDWSIVLVDNSGNLGFLPPQTSTFFHCDGVHGRHYGFYALFSYVCKRNDGIH